MRPVRKQRMSQRSPVGVSRKEFELLNDYLGSVL